MRRRSFLAATAGATSVGIAGCLGGEVVEKVQRTVRVPAHRGWVHEIDSLDGSGQVGYEIRSEESVFEVFFFTDESAFRTYEEYTMGDGMDSENEDALGENAPAGHEKLSKIAVENAERGVYESVVPDDGSRVSVDAEPPHFLVVDHSNYGMVGVADTAEPLPVTVGLEVVQGRF